ncbi:MULTISPECIES: DUF6159 family protein [Oleiagrimonas]|uniref:Glycerophosphoryl diester phosphodiesterase membrane domain-containing protein n=1 Tax=Oleiagrimonas citrea TaxID=1665687 RepID=A0A846ZLU4_9GAMM|nr:MULTISPECIES: DUF6159 family protein [Oleiagrimonas]NKZ38510.1 hypothetical protein [Oleiagrimonas citrea]RAP58244.1 hypothetical protein BTJ49_04530 [Oleiagrimonas sp. MCCC 1A03011]
MAGRFARSWALAKASAGMLNRERRLLVFPLLSGLCCLLVLASFAAPVFAAFEAHSGSAPVQSMQHSSGFYIGLFVFYVVQYSVIFFFNTALVGSAMACMNGERPSVGDGLRLAASKWPQILGYALIASTVGMVLRMLQERLGLIGRLLIGLVGLAWTVATFLVVPVLAATDVGPYEAVKRSTQLLKQTWGENIIGNAGISVVFSLGFMLIVVALFAGITFSVSLHAAVLIPVLAVLGVLAFIALALIQSALQGIYAAALYRYAEYGDAGNGFDQALLDQAFRSKR